MQSLLSVHSKRTHGHFLSKDKKHADTLLRIRHDYAHSKNVQGSNVELKRASLQRYTGYKIFNCTLLCTAGLHTKRHLAASVLQDYTSWRPLKRAGGGLEVCFRV